MQKRGLARLVSPQNLAILSIPNLRPYTQCSIIFQAKLVLPLNFSDPPFKQLVFSNGRPLLAFRQNIRASGFQHI